MRDGRMTIIGSSPGMQALRDLLQRVAPTDASVLVTGESGVGKELVARGLHEQSRRAAGPFVAINCSAIPEGLIEAELFGHEKGSFTGALRTHPGVFERGSGGTLFLDEISEMPARMQSRLLRVLQTRRYTRVGGAAERPTDVRIVAATNRDVTEAVADGLLRQDLLYRLAVFPIHVPPLRARGADVVELALAFLAELNAAAGTRKCFAGDIDVFLRSHDWPGNVRELRNCIERAYILADQQLVLEPGLLLHPARDTGEPAGCLPVRVGTRLDEAERQLIMATLIESSGNKRRAAALLGCSIKTLYNKLQHYRATGAGSSLQAMAD
ncbi:MAG: sigma-54-dependent Fis family transcriptional regulator [Gammaproteobacteria bacterium]|nr:sigma-54-dependent Fis family transcriptional regulator [Gammaproteobacteria bacterium]